MYSDYLFASILEIQGGVFWRIQGGDVSGGEGGETLHPTTRLNIWRFGRLPYLKSRNFERSVLNKKMVLSFSKHGITVNTHLLKDQLFDEVFVTLVK